MKLTKTIIDALNVCLPTTTSLAALSSSDEKYTYHFFNKNNHPCVATTNGNAALYVMEKTGTPFVKKFVVDALDIRESKGIDIENCGNFEERAGVDIEMPLNRMLENDAIPPQVFNHSPSSMYIINKVAKILKVNPVIERSRMCFIVYFDLPLYSVVMLVMEYTQDDSVTDNFIGNLDKAIVIDIDNAEQDNNKIEDSKHNVMNHVFIGSIPNSQKTSDKQSINSPAPAQEIPQETRQEEKSVNSRKPRVKNDCTKENSAFIKAFKISEFDAALEYATKNIGEVTIIENSKTQYKLSINGNSDYRIIRSGNTWQIRILNTEDVESENIPQAVIKAQFLAMPEYIAQREYLDLPKIDYSKYEIGSKADCRNAIECKFVIKGVSEDFLKKLYNKSISEKYKFLHAESRDAILVKKQDIQFNVLCEIKSLLRDYDWNYFSISPRKGYYVATFMIDKNNHVKKENNNLPKKDLSQYLSYDYVNCDYIYEYKIGDILRVNSTEHAVIIGKIGYIGIKDASKYRKNSHVLEYALQWAGKNQYAYKMPLVVYAGNHYMRFVWRITTIKDICVTMCNNFNLRKGTKCFIVENNIVYEALIKENSREKPSCKTMKPTPQDRLETQKIPCEALATDEVCNVPCDALDIKTAASGKDIKCWQSWAMPADTRKLALYQWPQGRFTGIILKMAQKWPLQTQIHEIGTFIKACHKNAIPGQLQAKIRDIGITALLQRPQGRFTGAIYNNSHKTAYEQRLQEFDITIGAIAKKRTQGHLCASREDMPIMALHKWPRGHTGGMRPVPEKIYARWRIVMATKSNPAIWDISITGAAKKDMHKSRPPPHGLLHVKPFHVLNGGGYA